ncbi:MAG: cupin domain-containing protein [Sedimentisphaerales bacterium]|nr:cupin domain-containing protein [Sedimentisphaerales bacterium]
MCRNQGQAFVITLDGQHGHQDLLDPRLQSIRIRSGKVKLETGQSCGRHSTEHCEELLIILAGEGHLVLGDGRRLAVGSGMVAYIGPQTIHDVVNSGQEPLVYIYCVVPAD